jgi:hypothetical protein
MRLWVSEATSQALVEPGGKDGRTTARRCPGCGRTRQPPRSPRRHPARAGNLRLAGGESLRSREPADGRLQRRPGASHRQAPVAPLPGGRGDSATIFDEACWNIGRVVDQVEHGVEAVGIAVALPVRSSYRYATRTATACPFRHRRVTHRGILRRDQNGLLRALSASRRGRRGMLTRVTKWIAVLVIIISVAAVGSRARGADRPPDKVHWALMPGSLRTAPVPQVLNAHERTFLATDFVATGIDNAPTGASQGDELAVSGRLRNASGEAIGRLEVHEVLTSISPQLIQIAATLRLHQSQIDVAGVQRATQQTTLAVVGGSGRQVTVRGGQLTAVPGPNNSTKLTLSLLR